MTPIKIKDNCFKGRSVVAAHLGKRTEGTNPSGKIVTTPEIHIFFKDGGSQIILGFETTWQRI